MIVAMTATRSKVQIKKPVDYLTAIATGSPTTDHQYIYLFSPSSIADYTGIGTI